MLSANLAPSSATELYPVAAASGRRHEVDFAVGDTLIGNGYRFVQATVSLSDASTRKRELSELAPGMRTPSVPEGWMVTIDEEEELETAEDLVRIVPAQR